MSVITLLAINAKLFQYWENLFFTQDLVMFLLIFFRIKKGGGGGLAASGELVFIWY